MHPPTRVVMAWFDAEADSDFNCLQFFANHKMHSLLPDNCFANASLDENSLTSLLGLPSALFPQTTHTGCSKIFVAAEDVNVNSAADLQQRFAAGTNVPQHHKYFATTSGSNANLGGREPATSVLPPFPPDPAIVKRSAKYSVFAKEICQKAEESAPTRAKTVMSETALEFPMSGKDWECNRRKRRNKMQKVVNSKALKVKSCKGAGSCKDAVEDSKHKAEQSNNDNCAEKIEDENNVKTPLASSEKPNYIHVRARRGEATDSHSLAERVRREKISERMKLLQDLVPGCSKITGKALLLEEIINHIQSLQRQVEFLSMKLATHNHRFDFDMDLFCAKDISTRL